MTLRAQVKTVDNSALREMSRSLVTMAGPFGADLIVGIATGGAEVARAMVDVTPESELVIVTRQRAGTSVKNRFGLPILLRALPRCLSNLLRRFEVWMREARFRLRKDQRPPQPGARAIDLSDSDAVLVKNASRILVVDDTVDSGETMFEVRSLMEQLAPHALIRTAALATTWRQVPIEVDYVLEPRTLLRLPSSFDA